MKKLIALLFIFVSMIVLASCGNDVKLENYDVMHETDVNELINKLSK